MMRKTFDSTGPRASVIALLAFTGAFLASPSASKADSLNSLINYSTSGTVSTSAGVDGPGVISFNSVPTGSFSAPSAFSLGSFQVAPLPSGVSTTYTNTPFTITYLTNSINGTVPTSGSTSPVVLQGFLNGMVTGSNQSSVIATFNPSPPITFNTGGLQNTLQILGETLALVPSTTNGGLTTAQAQIVTTGSLNGVPVPEPTSIAIFVMAMGGLGVRRQLRRAGRKSS